MCHMAQCPTQNARAAPRSTQKCETPRTGCLWENNIGAQWCSVPHRTAETPEIVTVEHSVDDERCKAWMSPCPRVENAECSVRRVPTGRVIRVACPTRAGTLRSRCVPVDTRRCRVVLGEILHLTTGGEAVQPAIESAMKSKAYHAVCGDRLACVGTFREFVVYTAHQVYPEYVVYYKREYDHEEIAV